MQRTTKTSAGRTGKGESCWHRRPAGKVHCRWLVPKRKQERVPDGLFRLLASSRARVSPVRNVFELLLAVSRDDVQFHTQGTGRVSRFLSRFLFQVAVYERRHRGHYA